MLPFLHYTNHFDSNNTEYVYFGVLNRKLLEELGPYAQSDGKSTLAFRIRGSPGNPDVRDLALLVDYSTLGHKETLLFTSTKSSLTILSSSRVPGSSGSLIVLMISNHEHGEAYHRLQASMPQYPHRKCLHHLHPELVEVAYHPASCSKQRTL